MGGTGCVHNAQVKADVEKVAKAVLGTDVGKFRRRRCTEAKRSRFPLFLWKITHFAKQISIYREDTTTTNNSSSNNKNNNNHQQQQQQHQQQQHQQQQELHTLERELLTEQRANA